jgi:RNA-directed DNA polymerase
MLAALEQGVKGGKWFSLMDKVYSERNLWAGYQQVAANGGAPGVDHVTIDDFDSRLIANLRRLSESLRNGTYQPQAIRRCWIPKPGSREMRPLGIPTVRDRVAQTALRHVMEPIFERDFAEHSYGFRPGRGCKDALRRVDELVKAGHVYVVDADLKSYFDTIPHDKLMARVREKLSDGRVLSLVEAFLKAGIMDGLDQWTPEQGSPQGAVISPLLSNIYLNSLDHHMASQGFEMVRYADDFVVLCRTPEEAERALAEISQWVQDNGLVLHPTKTRIVDERIDGFDFLGYHFDRGRKWPRAKSLKKLKDAIRSKTRRTNGRSLEVIIADANRTLRGWFEYFKHSLKTTFRPVDSYVRGRLRSILRKRTKRRGRARGSDHQRWPNAFFAARGLFSLVTAHTAACRSS